MAVTPTPRPTAADIPALRALADWPARLPVAVALSGGADSTALLHGAVQQWSAAQVSAIHVHHGLQLAADDFARHCSVLCERWNVPLQVVRVDAQHAPGDSPEDAARNARYRALAEVAAAAGACEVLLGQHADDQVETVLLALSRGAGLGGLAAMPERMERHGMRFGRPFLAVAASDLRSWLQREGIDFVDDPSNSNTALTRNRIRHGIVPAIAQAFPHYRTAFARSARHAAAAGRLLGALAEADLAVTGTPPALGALRALSRDRQANLLRHWLRVGHDEAASTAQLDELLGQIAACTTRGHQIRIRVGRAFAVREGDHLVLRRWV